MQLYLRYGLMALAVVAALWLLRSATRRVQGEGDGRVFLGNPLETRSLDENRRNGGSDVKELKAHDDEEDGDADVVMVDDFYSSKLSPEAKARLKAKHIMYEEIKQNVTENPDGTADLLRNWMHEDGVPS